MCDCNRRTALKLAGVFLFSGSAAQASQPRIQHFMREAFRMRAQALAAGDQPYGAVLVMRDEIIGYGPSRVILDRNPERHAERVAISEARAKLGRDDLSGALLISTSVPCLACQAVAAEARVERMIHGHELVDAGAPRPSMRR